MFDLSKCDKCGDCLVRCQYVDYDRGRAIQEFTALTEGKEPEILRECVTCMACDEYCTKGANPFDLICQLQEKTNALTVPEKMLKWVERGLEANPGEITRGQPNKPVLSICFAERLLPQGAIEGQMFDGLTVVKGRDYFCYFVYIHMGMESTARKNAWRFVDNLAKLGNEVVFLHDECYAMIIKARRDYGVEVPFKSIHIIDYMLNYLKEHRSSITKLNRKIAYQRPCASRYTQREAELDELFHLIGVERVARKHDREDSLCCGYSFSRIHPEKVAKFRDMNLEDAKAHGAETMVFLCPWCMSFLSEPCHEYGLAPIFISDLCRVALGERPFPS